jgi:RNA polymerase sigma factor (sigma-70 family)
MSNNLHEIGTQWTQVHQAFLGNGDAAARAQGELMQRYGGAIRRYLQAALRDQTAVDDLTQEFAVALVDGSFKNVQPDQGRFRDYLKGVLFNLVRQHWRRVERRIPAVGGMDIDLTDPASFPNACEAQFRQSWRDELLARTWEALAIEEPSFFTVLHFRAAHPDMPSQQMADELGPQLGKPLTPQAARQTLHRARKLFAALLMKQIAGTLECPSPSAIYEELCDLDLAAYVKPSKPRPPRE